MYKNLIEQIKNKNKKKENREKYSEKYSHYLFSKRLFSSSMWNPQEIYLSVTKLNISI